MHLSEKMPMENSAANQESNGEMFVRRVASSGLVIKFKVDNGKIPSKHTISSQEVSMSGGKQNVKEPLDNLESKCSPNTIPLLEQSHIIAAEARSKKISPFDNAKVAPQDEIIDTAVMVDKCTTVVAKQIIPTGTAAVDSSNCVSRMKMNKTSFGEKANKMEHLVAENGGNNGGMVLHTCNECGKSFKHISSLHGHTGIHRREEYKLMRMIAEQPPMAVGASHVVSSPISRETKKDEMKKMRFAARARLKLSMKLRSHQPDDLSASMTCSNKHISEVEVTDEMREVSEILVTLSQNFSNDSTVHVSSSALNAECSVCTTCKRTFSSYQALGGHMSIHNNKPNKNNLLEDCVGAGSSSGGGGGGERCTWKHVCGKCNEMFPSGKSLGGHKRKHWWEEYKMARLLEDGNVKPPLSLASDAVQQPQEAMSLGNEIELPESSSVSDEDVASGRPELMCQQVI